MTFKRGKYSYKVDEFRGLLTAEDLDEFDNMCRFNPSYTSIRSWFAVRGHRISINAISNWWRANFLNREEIRLVNSLITHLEMKDTHRLHAASLKLALTAANILDLHLSGKLVRIEPKFLVERQKELFTRVLAVTKS